jgi:hypothetical protein
MPDFEFTNPEGRRFTITGPSGATTEQAWSVLQQHLGSANKQSDSGDRRPNDPVAYQDRTINISSTDGSNFTFPEGMPLDEIQTALDKHYGRTPAKADAWWQSSPVVAPQQSGGDEWWKAAPIYRETPKFGSDEYVNALAEKHSADPNYVRGLVDSQAASKGVGGMFMSNELTNKAGAAVSALSYPLTGAGVKGDTYSQRYGHDLDLQERGHLVPLTPEEIEVGKRNIELTIAEQRFNRMADYAARGRRFEGLSDAKLLKVWTAAYDKMEDGPPDDVAQEALTFDLDAEYEIRGLEPPYQEWLERRWAERSSADKTKR